MSKKYRENVTREFSFFSIKAWHEGESRELEKWIGFGFFNHIFVSKDGIVTLYYDVDEGDIFHKILEEKLTEELFNELCDYFFELIRQSNDLNSNEEIYSLSVKTWPALTIFDELSKYPEFGNNDMVRRLIRIRTTTESFAYELEGKREKENSHKNYIFFQGKLYFNSFEDFIKEKEIEIIK
jgi:hypothetical protein|tara:strand:- start:5300 stop:5845 length:546 start_codon:yes stop_codon:yes gene_type:complete